MYLGGSGWVCFGGTENDFRILDRLEIENVVEDFWSNISKHFEQVVHDQNLIPF